MNKRFLSLLLALLMVVSLLPTAAFAAVGGEDAVPVAAPAAEEDGKATTATPAVVAEEAVPTVPVVEEIPAELADVAPTNLALNQSTATYTDSGDTLKLTAMADIFPLALSYWSSGNNNPYQAIKGTTASSTDIKNRWSDWEQNTSHDPTWFGVAFETSTAGVTAKEGQVLTLVPHLVNKAKVMFVDENGGTNSPVTFPTEYKLQYYTGPVENLTFDTRTSYGGATPDANSQTPGSGRVREWGVDHPLNVDSNWADVTGATYPAVVESNGTMLEVTFDTVSTPILRVLCTPKSGKWVGIQAFEAIGYKTPASNLCRPSDGATVTATVGDVESGTSFTGDKVIDGNQTTRWSTNKDAADPSVVIDLGAPRIISSVVSYWCGEGQSAVSGYTISVSNSATDPWETVKTYSGTVVAVRGDNDAHTPIYDDFDPIAARYVKLESTGYRSDASWKSMALWEVEVYRDHQAPFLPETPSRNLCRPTDGVTVTATAKSNETASFTPDKAIDGDTTTKPSRWSSANNSEEQWLQIDLGALRTVSIVKLFWERLNVTAYTLQVSEDNTNWNTVYTCTSRIAQNTESLSFTPTAARYIKINVTGHDDQGASGYSNIALYEVEAYRDANAIPQAASDVLATITSQDAIFALQNGKLVLNPAITIPEDFTVTFAANLEQVVGADHTVYTPVVDKEVAIDLTVTDEADPANTASTPGDSPIRAIIPGAHRATENEGGNPKPAVIPEIMEWYSHGTNAGYKDKSYTLGSTVRILYRYAFDSVAKELQADLKDLYGINAELVRLSGSFATLQNGTVQDGDIVLFDVDPNNSSEDTRNRVQGYDDETYGMEIFGGNVYIYATHPTGAYWGTRTLLQGMKLSEGGKSFPNGTLRDYPEFKVRGFVLDVGRKPISMKMLQDIVKNMAWYKLNDFHVHLNDNLITMEDYKTNEESWDDDEVYKRADLAYSAFRLESNIQEEAGAIPLTAKDYHYTKAEYKSFVENSAKLGVTIMSEIDVPAHAKAITDAFPSLQLRGYRGDDPMAQKHPYNDHLDLSTQEKHDASVNKTKEIFDEYLDAGIFGNSVHFGADEYYASGTPYRRYVKDMINYLKDKKSSSMPDLTIRQWGSLSSMSSSEAGLTDADLKLIVDGVQMNLWNTGWANPVQMYNLGYDLINTVDDNLYIVPGAGYYNDYLPHNLYNNWTPNCFGSTWLPASSDQVLGAAFAIWNDLIDTQANGFSEEEIFDRFFDAIPYISVKMWGEGSELDRPLAEAEANAAIIGLAPRTNPYYETGKTGFFTYDFTDNTDKSGNRHDLTLTNAEINSSKSILILNGGSSYAETGLDRLGWGNQLSFRALKLTASDEEEILFEADHAYGDFSIKALPVEDGEGVWKLGFSRELYDYEFDAELPLGEWVSITLTNEPQSTKLSVNGGTPVAAVGKFVSKPDSNTQFWGKTGITSSSFELPVARIGSKQNAFRGYIAAVTTGEPIEVPDAFVTATAPSEKRVPASSNPVEGPASYAVDGDLNTMWHSNYSGDTPDNPNDLREKPEKRYIQLNLAAPVTVSGLSYTPRSDVSNGTVTSYRIEVSTDGKTFTSVASGDWARTADKKTVTFDAPQQDVIAVRLYGVTTYSNNQYMSALEVELAYDATITLTNANTAITVGDVTWGETAATAEITVALNPSGFVLTEGTDYTVSYANNTAVASEATATITGTGNYTGSVTATFTVPAKPVDLSTATVTFAQTSYPLENGKAEPEPTVKVGNTTLLRGLDYTVTYTNNTAEGTATATVTGIGDYTGENTATFTVTQAIVKKNLSDTAKTKVTLSQVTFPYEGVALTPEPVVTYDGETLTKGTHYTVSYSRNTAIGTATVTVTGRAPYCEGSASTTFTIIDPSKGNDLSDVSKTTVTLNPTQYDYTGEPIIPTFITVRYNGVRLVQDTDFTVELSQNVNGGTGVLVIHGKGEYYGSFVATFTIVGGGTGAGDDPGSSSGNNSSGSGSSAGIPSPVITSTQTTRGDGVTTTVKTDSTGAMVARSTYDNGAKVIADIPVTGPVTAVVTVPAQADTVTVTIPTRTEPTPGQVAVILHPDGTEEIIKTSMPTENGLELTLDASATIQVIDNAKTFIDVPDDSWAKNAIDFVTSREIFNGTGNSTFSPSDDMSRAMVCTVLANLDGEDTKGGATWYEKAVDWAQANGVSDGSNPAAIVTREQLAAMLYRYAGSPTVMDEVPRRFRDRDNVSDWAELAVTWAVENDLLRGRSSEDGLDLAPQATASRAEVATVLQRYVALLK